VAVVVDDFDRENEGDFVAISELVTSETINFMVKHARGLVCQAVSEERADELELAPMTEQPTDPFGTAFTVSVDHVSTTTGISAAERAHTVNAVVDAKTAPSDLKRPGHIFPLTARSGGVLARRGHTEAMSDLARLAGYKASGVVCEIMNEDGSMARLPELEKIAKDHDLPIVSIEDLVRYRNAIGDLEIQQLSASRLPTAHGEFRVSVFESEDPAARSLVLLEREVERTGSDTPLVRIHSECLTGETFESNRCDCGPQLDKALKRIGTEGGALVYLRQEGRGIGLAEKIRAYALQDEGMDTVEANVALGHQADARRYGAAAAVLKTKGYRRVRLLTNNPEKVESLSVAGIEIVAREDISIPVTAENRRYLHTKVRKFGHMLQGA